MASATKRQRPRAHAGASEQGKATAQRVIDAARELLMTKGHAQFSVRNVAAQAELHLANVQYYFPTRDDLVRAIVKDIDARYRAAYTQALANAPPDRVARFRAILKFALRDIERAPTRRFFIQLWGLLNSLDGRSSELLSEAYAIDIQHLSECVAELEPEVHPVEIRRRATLLAAMIEGLLVVHSAHSRNKTEMKALISRAEKACMQIARGNPDGALL
jgi:AcrR family transcriptional regulator